MYYKAGRAIGFNQTTKQPIEQEYKYSELVGKTMVLGNYTLFDDISDEKNYIKVCSDGNEDLLDNVFYDEWIKKYCLQQTFTITVLGHEKRCCGKMICIPWEQEGENKNVDFKNVKYSGGFLIKSVTHYFKNSVPAYFQKMSLIKNGYQNLDTTNEGSVLKQEDQRYRNSFDDNSYTNVNWNNQKPSGEGLFNRKSKPEDFVSGLYQNKTNAVDTRNVFEKAWGWLTGD